MEKYPKKEPNSLDKATEKILPFPGDLVDDEYRKLISSLDENLCGRDCLVGFRDGSFMFGRNRYNPNVLDSYLWLSSEHCEVIGNIYEVENEV